MSTQSPKNDRWDAQIPCRLLPATELDALEAIPPEQRAELPVGGLVADALSH